MVFFILVYGGLNQSRVFLPIEICQEKKGGGTQHFRHIACSDSVALWKTQPSHHPSGTSLERTTSPENREIGLAGFESQIVVIH
jgi:hypothetical protein